ncbi:probable E3 ubiquitin-protein ligase LUL3 [Malania oleifera]|uniref:probable E3 ubiquitin-protein ligase LUL3 n=1 Tax=Malania oleifera TaxID=397392 RepID=UPI0025ADAEEC|nr:probable E3 ubiquitin-protein ligase LUL3 [Malania oleifera]
MGLLWSSRRRHNHGHRYQPNPVPPPAPSSQHPTPPASYAFAANAPYPASSHPPYPALPAPSPPPHLSFNTHQLIPYNPSNYARPVMAPAPFPPYLPNQANGWAGFRPPVMEHPTPPYVDHQSAKKIKNEVNVQKGTIRVDVDEKNSDSYLVSFTFDALVDGSVSIFYFAKEGINCTFTPLYPEIYKPAKVTFEKGLGQKFSQPSGTGIDLGFFDVDELSKPSPEEDVFPLVIVAEACLPPLPVSEQLAHPPQMASPHMQITQAILKRDDDGHFQVRVIKQILWVDRVRYELREIYGIKDSDEAGIDNNDAGEECVICMTEPKDTAVLPCRHMCLCSECAKELRLQSSTCPICRQPIQKFIEIKVNRGV